MTDDPDLRSRLERIASLAGDPSEHGLERVAARRHRRLRRRRGAVATAAVLALLAVGVPLISSGLGDGGDRVTASEDVAPAGAPAELPRRLEVRCEQEGIVVPVASVRPERDGMHIRVVNQLDSETQLQVEGRGWSSGDIAVPRGVSDVRQPVPPGELTVGCDIDGEPQRRRVDLVDPSGYYVEPGLACDHADIEIQRDFPVEPPEGTIIAAVRQAIGAHLADGDAISAPRGYPAQRLSDATDDPYVQVERDGEVVAFAHVRGDGGSVGAPWTSVTKLEICESALNGAAGADDPDDEGSTTSRAAGSSPG